MGRRVDGGEADDGLLHGNVHHLLVPDLVDGVNHPLRHVVGLLVVAALLLGGLLARPDDGLEDVDELPHAPADELGDGQPGREDGAEEAGELADLARRRGEVGDEVGGAVDVGRVAAALGADEYAARGHGHDVEQLVEDGRLGPLRRVGELQGRRLDDFLLQGGGDPG